MIRNNIKKLRAKKGITQRQLADLAGTSQQQVQRIEAGIQAARVDLGERLATALDVQLHEVFPDLVTLRRKPTLNEDEMADAGIEVDPSMHRFCIRLKDKYEQEFIVSRKEADRLKSLTMGWERRPFAVFHTTTHKVAINLQELALCQFLFDPMVTPDEELTDGEANLKVWFVGDHSPEEFGVDYESGDEDDGELGNLAGLFHDLEMTDEEDHPVSFLDDDGEKAVLLPSAVSLCTVPLSFVMPSLFTAEMEGEEEDIELRTANAPVERDRQSTAGASVIRVTPHERIQI